MSKDSGRTISFAVDTVEEREEIIKYAKAKGLGTASNLARFAVKQYMLRYPLNCTKRPKIEKGLPRVQKDGEDPQAVQPQAQGRI